MRIGRMSDEPMETQTIDRMIDNDNWSELSRHRSLPAIDFERLYAYRLGRIRAELTERDTDLVVFVNPVSLRYAVDYRAYGLFQSHIPLTYVFVAQDGPVVAYDAYGKPPGADENREARAISVFGGGHDLGDAARLFAEDVDAFLGEVGARGRRVAVEYVNPSITQALLQKGMETTDGVVVSEMARRIKSDDEIECIRWALAVAEHGAAKLREAVRPGVSELQLWGLLNYTNLANNGDWHEGRMLASGPRINPWIQEASPRRLESGDLVGFDTDMVGPFGYFADLSRTFHCGPARPTARQKEVYRLAAREIEYNLALIKPGITFSELQHNAFDVPEAFREQAYPCIVHGVGMCDEYPYIKPRFRGPVAYDGVLEAGMVLCVESYMGAVGERDGVKLEQQVLVTADGYEMLSTFPLEDSLLE